MPGDKIPVLKTVGDLSKEPQAADSASRKLYQDVSPSVVKIETPNTVGSGFAVGKSGQFLTNFHVVINQEEVFVRGADGQRYRARVKSADDVKDMALLEIEGKAPPTMKPLPFAEAKSPVLGGKITAFGHPEGYPDVYASPGTLLEATNNLKRFSSSQLVEFARLSADPKDKQLFLKNDLLQASIQIRHGNSGGPAVDDNGKVLGVSVYKKEAEDQDKIGYFIPASDVQSFLDNDQSKFKFNYEYRISEEWPKLYLNGLSKHPLLTSAGTAGIAYLSARSISDLGRVGAGLSAGLAAYGGMNLVTDDISLLSNATNNRDLLKAGLSTFADSAFLTGGILRTWMGVGTGIAPGASSALLTAGESKLATAIGAGVLGSSKHYLTRAGKIGLALIAVGVAAKIASDLIPNRLVNTGVERRDGLTHPPFWLGRGSS